MISRGRKYRIAIGLIAGWAMAVLVPGVVAGLMVYQVNVRRIDSVVPTLVSGVRAEVTVVDAEMVHITPVMRATLMVASGNGGDSGDGLAYAGSDASSNGDDMGSIPLRESSTGALPAHTGAESGTARSAASIGAPFGAGVYLPIQPTEGASSSAMPHGPFTGTATETMTPMPLTIEKDEPVIEIEPLPTPTLAATETSTPTSESTPTLAATETLQPTIAPVDTWTPAPTFEPTPTVTVSPVPIVLPTETATTSPLGSPLATPSPALPSVTPEETETPAL